MCIIIVVIYFIGSTAHYFRWREGYIWINAVTCFGSELNLLQCIHGYHILSPYIYEDVGVQCIPSERNV